MKIEIETREYTKYLCDYESCLYCCYELNEMKKHELIHKVKRDTVGEKYVYYVENNEQAQLVTSTFECWNHLGDITKPGWYYFKYAEDYFEDAKLTPITDLLGRFEEDKKEIQDNIDKVKALCLQIS